MQSLKHWNTSGWLEAIYLNSNASVLQVPTMHQRVSAVKFVNRQLDQGVVRSEVCWQTVGSRWREERWARIGLGPWWALKDQSGPSPSSESNLRAGCFLHVIWKLDLHLQNSHNLFEIYDHVCFEAPFFTQVNEWDLVFLSFQCLRYKKLLLDIIYMSILNISYHEFGACKSVEIFFFFWGVFHASQNLWRFKIRN